MREVAKIEENIVGTHSMLEVELDVHGLFVNKGPLFGGVWYRGVFFSSSEHLQLQDG